MAGWSWFLNLLIMQYKVDLHSHSIVSPDGALTKEDYQYLLDNKILDYIAITDHNEISFAQKMQQELGQGIIVGEEIMTIHGEVIGLFLREKVAPHQSVKDTLAAIHKQGGIASIPHPFDILRYGIGEREILANVADIDILEGFNARIILPWYNAKALRFATQHHIPAGVGSDAHVRFGIGGAYALVEKPFTASSAKKLLQEAKLIKRYQPLLAYFAPKFNRLKHIL